jgi:hypothetical protein
MADADRADPIEEEAERARNDPDRSLLPSNDGSGPGAGETPVADVTVEPPEHDAEDAPDTVTPSLGGPPVTEGRPVLKSSQLDGAPPEREA